MPHQIDGPRRILATGRFLKLIDKGGWEYVERVGVSGVVAIVAVTIDQKLLLVEQFRPPLGSHTIEIPAGLAGDLADAAEEELSAAARRELLEETGFRADTLEFAFSGPSSAGLTNEMIDFFVARDVRRVGPAAGDGSESIVLHEVPLAEVRTWLSRQIHRQKVIDPKIFTGLELLRET